MSLLDENPCSKNRWESLTYPFGRLTLRPLYCICEIAEHVGLSEAEIREIIFHLDNEYQQRNFGIIFNVVNSYSTDPVSMKKIAEMRSLVAIAYVVSSHSRLIISQLEGLYMKRPVFVDYNMVHAIQWIESRVKAKLS